MEYSVVDIPETSGFYDFIKKYRSLIGVKLLSNESTHSAVLSVKETDSKLAYPNRISLSNTTDGTAVTSYGCILRCGTDNPKYLVVKRKESPGYIDIVHGSYRQSQLYFILQELSPEERHRLVTWKYRDLWYDLHLKAPEGSNYSHGKAAWKELVKILPELCKFVEYREENRKRMWLFPKGRLTWCKPEDIQETPLECAIREFKEETNGICLHAIGAEKVFENPISEKHLGSNSKLYQTLYYVYKCDTLPEITQFPLNTDGLRDVSSGEVENIQLVDLKDIEGILSKERCDIINYIEQHKG
mgnify:CR=1 FL=1